MGENCLIIIAHVKNVTQATILKNCIESIKKYSTGYPILLCTSGDVDLIKNELSQVNHHIFTSVNTLTKLDDPLLVYYLTSSWKLTYCVPLPRYYYGFAQMQKTALAIQGATSLGYRNFLVINYDTLFLENGFIDYMFSEPKSIFFNFPNSDIRMSTDVFKLDMPAARAISTLADYNTYKAFAHNQDAQMLEDVLGHTLNYYKIDYKRLPASNNSMFQLSPFKVLVNNSFNEGAMAAIHNGIVHLLITNQGHPRYTLDGKLEIGYNNNYVSFDVSNPTSLLYPIAPYEGKSIEISIKTSFGEVPVVITKEMLENSKIEWY
jgi:hypothetical protein